MVFSSIQPSLPTLPKGFDSVIVVVGFCGLLLLFLWFVLLVGVVGMMAILKKGESEEVKRGGRREGNLNKIF